MFQICGLAELSNNTSLEWGPGRHYAITCKSITIPYQCMQRIYINMSLLLKVSTAEIHSIFPCVCHTLILDPLLPLTVHAYCLIYAVCFKSLVMYHASAWGLSGTCYHNESNNVTCAVECSKMKISLKYINIFRTWQSSEQGVLALSLIPAN